MPCGAFTIDVHGTNPLVLVAAGVGLTPIMSVLEHSKERHNKGAYNWRKVSLIQSYKHPGRHLMKDRIDKLVGAGLTEAHVFYTRDSGTPSYLRNTKIN